MDSNLSSTRAYFGVFGGLLHQPTLVDSIDYPLDREDFNTNEFYEILFVAIHNLYVQGIDIIDEFAIDSYLSAYPQQFAIFQENNGLKYISDVKDLGNVENYEYYYHILKKFSLLRYYESQGLDVRPVYDYTITDAKLQEEETKKLENITEQQIIDRIEEAFVLKPTIKYCSNSFVDEGSAGDGLFELIQKYQESPDFGYPLTSIGLSTLARGARKGMLYLRSAGTGTGKTRMGMMDACNFAIPWYYDLKQKEFIYTGHCTPTLYIEVENSRKDLQIMAVSCVSGIPTSTIKNARCTAEEMIRVKQAAKFVEEAPLYIVYLDDYSITDVENIVKKYVMTKDVEICVFDYLQSSLKMTNEIRQKGAVGLQEYQILRVFATRLKALAERLGITILSATQLNREAISSKYKDEASIEGAKSVANKIDLGVICTRPSTHEMAKLNSIISHQIGCPDINLLQWCYKVRDGEYSRIIICSHLDLGTLRVEDCFVTDYDFNLIDMEFDNIEMVEEIIGKNSIIDDIAVDEETAPIVQRDFDW